MPIILRSPGAPPPLKGPILLIPIALIVIGCVGFLGACEVTLFGKSMAAPLSGWLTAAFGPEGVRPGLKLVSGLSAVVAGLGLALLLGMRRTLWTAPEVGSFWLLWRARLAAWAIFLCLLGGTIASILGWGAETRSGWLYEHWGPLGVRLGSIAILGALSVLSALYLVHLTRKIHGHPLYPKKDPERP